MMTNQNNTGSAPSADEQKAYLDNLKATFDRLPRQIILYLFCDRRDDPFAEATRQVVRAFNNLTDKIVFREFTTSHKMARKWNVEKAPVLIIDPEIYSIRWYGAPMGEEARIFLELLLLAGTQKSGLNPPAKKIMAKMAGKRQVKVFVSPSCPYCPQQAVNGIRAAIERPDIVSLEIIDIQCRPDIAEQYSARSVPQTFANDILIGMGAQPEELFCLSLEKMEPQTVFIPDSDAELVQTDLVIVGGGPAGLTAGIYGKRSGMRTVVIEGDALGGQVATTPVVENYPGFTKVEGKALVDIMVSHALEYVQVFQGERVISIEPGMPIQVQTTRRRFEAKALLLATGATHKKLGVPGEKRLAGRGVSYCSTCDGPIFKGKKVVMVGGGNSAVTEALYLNHMGVNVTLIHRRGDLRAQDILAKKLSENNIPVLWNTEVIEIEGKDRVNQIKIIDNKTQAERTLEIDGVFLAIGYMPSVELAQSVGVELTPDGYIKQDGKHRTNIRGIYSAGDVEGGYKQIVTAAGQGSSAALSIFEDVINPPWSDAQRAAG